MNNLKTPKEVAERAIELTEAFRHPFNIQKMEEEFAAILEVENRLMVTIPADVACDIVSFCRFCTKEMNGKCDQNFELKDEYYKTVCVRDEKDYSPWGDGWHDMDTYRPPKELWMQSFVVELQNGDRIVAYYGTWKDAYCQEDVGWHTCDWDTDWPIDKLNNKKVKLLSEMR